MVWKLTLALFLLWKRWGFFMPRPKIDRLLLVLIPIILLLLFLSFPVYAEIKTFVEEYTYQASEADSKLSSRVIALEQVKRLLLEKLGTYLESETEVKNLQLTKDRIVMLTAGIVGVEIIDEKWDGKIYYLKAKIEADPKEVTNSINKLSQDRQKTKELEETRKKADEALREVEKLRKELEITKAERPDFSRYNTAVNGLRAAVETVDFAKAHLEAQKDGWNKAVGLEAADWRKRGQKAFESRRYEEMIEAYSRAIELDPKHYFDYQMRGHAYYFLKDYHGAIGDYDKAIELIPDEYRKFLPDIYLWRARAYDELGDEVHMLEDYKTAVRLGASEPSVRLFEIEHEAGKMRKRGKM
jgi:tetratricopeptide (TPR) repeat protein